MKDSNHQDWPQTSDKEFSKRVCKVFIGAFLVQTFLTLGTICLLPAQTDALIAFYGTALPVYMLVFGAVIAKSGVENVFKGQARKTGQGKTEDSNG